MSSENSSGKDVASGGDANQGVEETAAVSPEREEIRRQEESSQEGVEVDRPRTPEVEEGIPPNETAELSTSDTIPENGLVSEGFREEVDLTDKERDPEKPDHDRKKAIVEALLYVSDQPLSLDRIADTISGCDKKEIRELVADLNEDYRTGGRAFEIVEVAQGYQVRTRVEFSKWIVKLKQQRPQRLTRASMESLAIIAYRQPVTRAEIETIRGVDTGAVLGSLLEKKLIRILGRKEVPGRPILYGTTQDFLELFGLKNLGSLPTLREIEGMFEKLQEEEAGRAGETVVDETQEDGSGGEESVESDARDEERAMEDEQGEEGDDREDWEEEEELEEEEGELEAGDLDDILRSTKTKFVPFEQEMPAEEGGEVEERDGGTQKDDASARQGTAGEDVEPEAPGGEGHEGERKDEVQERKEPEDR